MSFNGGHRRSITIRSRVTNDVKGRTLPAAAPSRRLSIRNKNSAPTQFQRTRNASACLSSARPARFEQLRLRSDFQRPRQMPSRRIRTYHATSIGLNARFENLPATRIRYNLSLAMMSSACSGTRNRSGAPRSFLPSSTIVPTPITSWRVSSS